MTEQEKIEIYNALLENPVIRDGNIYLFGKYKIELCKPSPHKPGCDVYIGTKNWGRWWDTNKQDYNQMYDLYIAVVNKYTKKTFSNPFENSNDIAKISYKFEQTITQNLPSILPHTMHTHHTDIIKQLKTAFENIVKQYQ